MLDQVRAHLADNVVTAFEKGADWLIPYAERELIPQLTDRHGLRLENRTLNFDCVVVDRDGKSFRLKTEIDYVFDRDMNSRGRTGGCEVTVKVPAAKRTEINHVNYVTRYTLAKPKVKPAVVPAAHVGSFFDSVTERVKSLLGFKDAQDKATEQKPKTLEEKPEEPSVIPNVEYRAYVSTLIHETVHVLDGLCHPETRRQRSPYLFDFEGNPKGMRGPVVDDFGNQVELKKDQRSYYTSPSEISAFSTQIGWLVKEKADRIMEARMKGHLELLKAAGDARKFFSYTVLDEKTDLLTAKMRKFVDGTDENGLVAVRHQVEIVRTEILRKWQFNLGYQGA